jgi:hypothetical protein
MMLLYDVFYADGTMDRSVPWGYLTGVKTVGTKAVCVNGEATRWVLTRGGWEEDVPKLYESY